MTTNVCTNATLQGTCGVGIFASFYSGYDWQPTPDDVAGKGGSGWQIAGFVNIPECQEVYETFKKRFKIVQQSPTRLNRNSGNWFFYVMYDTQVPRKSKKNPNPVLDIADNVKYKWPFKPKKVSDNALHLL